VQSSILCHGFFFFFFLSSASVSSACSRLILKPFGMQPKTSFERAIHCFTRSLSYQTGAKASCGLPARCSLRYCHGFFLKDLIVGSSCRIDCSKGVYCRKDPSDGWLPGIIVAEFVVEKILAIISPCYQWLPQGYLSEFRVQTFDNPHYELIGHSIYLCHGRWTDCHISATSSHGAAAGAVGPGGTAGGGPGAGPKPAAESAMSVPHCR